MTSMPNTARIRKTMEKLEFCVVQDAYVDVEAAQYAHAFFPASVWAEKDEVMASLLDEPQNPGMS